VAVVFALGSPFSFPAPAGAPVTLLLLPTIRRRGDPVMLDNTVCQRSTRDRATWQTS
jgi:hypothetical protein